jgi:hypothetical protein
MPTCASVYAERKLGTPPADQACFALAVAIYTHVTTSEAAAILRAEPVRVGDVFSQRDLQNRRAQGAALVGTAAQGRAVPGVQPAGVAAGTIAAVGTRAGQDAIAALTLNPAVLFLADEATKQLAKLSRFADVTFFIPVSGVEQSEEDADSGKLRYFGARLRLNFTGLSAGSAVWDRADELLKKRIAAAAIATTALAETLSTSKNLRACVAALLDGGTAQAVIDSCGAPFGFTPDLKAAAAIREELTKVRRAADAKYFGADIRYDIGDPTLGAVANSRGQFLFAGLAAGRNFGSGLATAGIRGRLGLRHAKLDSVDEAEFAAEGGVGFDLSRYVGEDELNVQGAVEFRHGNAPPNMTDQFQTNFVMLRASLIVPVTAGNSISINVGKPLSGEVSPVFSVNFNWGLLLAGTPAR